MRWMVLAFGLVLASAGAAQAEGIQTGVQLLANCQSKEPKETWSCRDYVSGALDAIYTAQSMTFVCSFIPPEGFSEDNAIGVVTDYLKTHPDDRSKSGAYSISAALTAAYPCPK